MSQDQVFTRGAALYLRVTSQIALLMAGFPGRGGVPSQAATCLARVALRVRRPRVAVPVQARGQSDEAREALPRRALTVAPPVTMTVPSLAMASDPAARGMLARQRIVPSLFMAKNGPRRSQDRTRRSR